VSFVDLRLVFLALVWYGAGAVVDVVVNCCIQQGFYSIYIVYTINIKWVIAC